MTSREQRPSRQPSAPQAKAARWDRLPDPYRSYLFLYRLGYFPMAMSRDSEFEWYSVSRRALIPLDEERFHVPRRLAKTIRQGRFETRFDTAFDDVLDACAEREDCWMNETYLSTYKELHRRGIAHSVEAWREGRLVGGLYGLHMGAFFCGESMFTRENDASKVCMVALVERLRQQKFEILDAQIINPHTARFGAIEVPREEFMGLLARALATERSFHPSKDA